MPKVIAPLSEKKVASLKTPGAHAVGGVAGLYLDVSSTGGRNWLFRYSFNGKRRDMSLGSFLNVGLAKAREMASQQRVFLQQHVDPLDARMQKMAVIQEVSQKEKTFEWCANEYIKSKQAEWKNAKHAQQWSNTLNDYAFPHIGSKFVSQLDIDDVLKCLEPIWLQKTETAKRLRGRIESVISWAITKNFRSEKHNPAQWKGYLSNVLATPSKVAPVESHKALDVDDMPDFMWRLQQKKGISVRALEFAIYTAVRSNEVREMSWREVDLQRNVWEIPASRMKANKAHLIPLSTHALRLLRTMPKLDGTDLVFPNDRNKPLSDVALSSILKRIESTRVL